MEFNTGSLGLQSGRHNDDNFHYSYSWDHLRELATDQVRSKHGDIFSKRVQLRLLEHADFETALAHLLSDILASRSTTSDEFCKLALDIYADVPSIAEMALQDISAFVERDPATNNPLYPFLFFRGFHALQCHRLSNWLWRNGQIGLSLLIQSRIVEQCSIDIHPAASIGCRVMFDHGTGIVIGETSVVKDDVSILHNVTLGGTGNESQDRHPKVMRGVMIGAGAKVLGNITIGEYARVAAGSVVLNDVPSYVTVVGAPARVVGNHEKRLSSQELK